MGTPFPGMDPYLERRGLWEEIHTRLIVAMADDLAAKIAPRYRAAVEQRTYLTLWDKPDFAGKPDVLVVAGSPAPFSTAPASTKATQPSGDSASVFAELPMQEEVTERYLEIREVETNRVITIIELLSPTNKSTREGRDEYDTKRMKVLRSMTHLVEIDLLRGGQPPAFKVQQGSGESDYRIVISRAFGRPTANVYLFSVRQPIPDIPIPLKRNEDEPILPLNQLIHHLYERARYDLIVDYQQPADPPLSKADATWAMGLTHT